MLDAAWLIPLFPFAAFLLHIAIGKRLGERSAAIGIVALAVAFGLSLSALLQTMGGASAASSWPWLAIGEWEIRMGFRVGPLEAVMLTMVTLVSWMVITYSAGYMHGDSRFNRFFSIVNLFVFAMLALVISDNLLAFFFAWEIMGLCSYLLIGHWFEDLDNARAAMKAFLTTRVGDVGFLLGIWLLFLEAGSLRFETIYAALAAGDVPTGVATFAALMLFAGAVGKSAQIPLQIWLPDAMAGPTPVSALIHAATMVAAGVFLVARAYPIFEVADPAALITVAFIGGITALLASLVATVQEDIKKTLAYSTISQLGYMMLALGVGGYVAGLFHLITHAFFKALLFLGSGSVIHGVGTQNMHQMGGLMRKMKVTGITFIIGTLALAGIPPFAGFFSKDEILLDAYHSEFQILFWMGVIAAFFTAYYMTRAVLLTFFGEPRDAHAFEHAHESPATMTLPLIVLAIPATLAGFAGAPAFGHWFQHFIALGVPHVPEPSGFVQALAVGAGLAGILVGWLVYGTAQIDRARLVRDLRPLYRLFKEKFYFDHAAFGVVAFTVALGRAVAAFDRWVVDGIVNGVAGLVFVAGRAARRLTLGSAQAYSIGLACGVVLGLIALQVLGG